MHERAQWVYESGPQCTPDGHPREYGTAGYLYFDDGILTAIQR
jgi:hypothetical protein